MWARAAWGVLLAARALASSIGSMMMVIILEVKTLMMDIIYV